MATLSVSDQKLAANYIALLQASYKKGMIVLGVYRGALPWDIRPVFLDPEAESSLFLMRVLQPGANISDQISLTWQSLPRLLSESYAVAGTGSVQIENDTKTIYWSLRRYCTNTLADNLDKATIEPLLSSASSSCIGLLTQLSDLEIRVTQHGHFTKSNIGVHNNRLLLLDPWYFSSLVIKPSGQSEQISVRSLSSLFLNLFGTQLEQDLIIAFQNALASEQQNQSFTELLKNCRKNTTPVYEDSKNTTPAPDIFKQKDMSAPRPVNFSQTPGPSKINTAPSGRIIAPRSNKPKSDNIIPQNRAASGNSSINQNTSSDGPKIISAKNLIVEPLKQLAPDLLSSRAKMFFAVALIASVLVMISSKAMRFSSSGEDVIKMQEDWESNSAPRQRRIAQEALEDGDKTAQEVIELDLLAGNNRPGTNSNFLRIAFNKLWREDLNSNDEKFAFSLALAGLYRVPSDKLPGLDELHPGILLSLLGDLSLQSGEGKFAAIDTEKLASLPGAYGGVFAELKKLGVETFADDSARAAARLITGANDQETFDAYINPSSPPEDAEERLSSIIPFCEMYPDLAKLILTSLAGRSDYLGQRVKWFVEDPIAQWNQVDENTLVYITIGLIPESMQSFERTVDLLNFPVASVRDQAKTKILAIMGKPYLANVLTLISKQPNLLSRSQTLGLLATTRVPADKVGPFLASWLSSNPDPEVVLQFLLASRDQRAYEANFVQLANYLARADFEISMQDMGLLLTHPEPLARALAFPRLDATKIMDRKILESWVKSETSPRLKEQIQAKLDTAMAEK